MPNPELPTIVFAGGGPSGLMAALGAAKKGYPVTIINKYPPGSRPQVVKLDSETIELLSQEADKTDPSDSAFIKRLKRTSGVVTIGEIEAFLRAKVDKQKNIVCVDQASITKMSSDLDPPSVEYECMLPGHLETVKVTLPFLHLVDSTGSRRETFRLAHKDKSEYEEQYDTLSHTAQGTTVFQFDANSSYDVRNRLSPSRWERFRQSINVPKTIFTPSFSASELSALKKDFGWDEDYPPKTYIISNPDRTEFYVGGEVPSQFLKIEDDDTRKEAIMKWNKHILKLHFKIPSDSPETFRVRDDRDTPFLRDHFKTNKVPEQEIERAVNAHLTLQNTAFNLVLSKLKNAVRVLIASDRQHVHTAVGDAIKDPNYHKGHGMNDAIKSANKFVECLSSNPDQKKTFDVERYRKYTSAMIKTHDKRLEDINKEYKKKGDDTPRIIQLQKQIASLMAIQPQTAKNKAECDRLFKKCEILRHNIINKMVALPFTQGGQAQMEKLSNQLMILNDLLTNYHPKVQKAPAIGLFQFSKYDSFKQERNKIWLQHEIWMGKYNQASQSSDIDFVKYFEARIQQMEILLNKIELYKQSLSTDSSEYQKADSLLHVVQKDITDLKQEQVNLSKRPEEEQANEELETPKASTQLPLS